MFQAFFQEYRSFSGFCQTSVLSLKTWIWLCFTSVTTRTRTTRTRTRTTTHQISQLLLTRFWPNFKRRFLGTSKTDSNCHGDICPGHICPGNICTYKEYLSCYWHDFDQTLKVGSWTTFIRFHLLWWRHLSRQHMSWRPLYISAISQLLLSQFWTIFLDPNFGGLDFYRPQFFWTKLL